MEFKRNHEKETSYKSCSICMSHDSLKRKKKKKSVQHNNYMHVTWIQRLQVIQSF